MLHSYLFSLPDNDGEQTYQDVCVDTSFMSLINDDHRVLAEQRILQ